MSGVSLSPNDIGRLNSVRKRQINITNWVDIQRKKNRDSGQQYVSRKRKIVVPARALPSIDRPCADKCRMDGCVTLSTYESRLKLFQNYYSMNHDGQSLFLRDCIAVREPLRRRKGKQDNNSQRTCTFDYYLQGQKVCKTNFRDTLSITNKRIQNIAAKIKDGVIIPFDMRGKHNNRPHRLAVDLNLIENFIKKIPRQPSHYCQGKTDKECLSPDLNLSKIWRAYNAQHSQATISIHLFTKIFKKLNLRFGSPRSDTCKVCDLFYLRLLGSKNELERNRILIDSKLHHSKAEQAYQFLSDDTEIAKNTPNVTVLSVDLQQVLFCPTLTHSSMFYQRQLSNYNLAIHNMGTGEATMCLWNETIARRGSQEIASCTLRYITQNFQPLQNREQRKLIVWSDRCVGQNNNWKIISLYNYLLSGGYFAEVHQKFLCTGHSFLPCDRGFALNEKSKKTAMVYVPSQWKEVIAGARLNKPFQIFEMEQSDFKNFETFEENLIKKGKANFKITKVMWIKQSIEDPGSVSGRSSHNILKPFESSLVFKQFPYLPSPSAADLPRLYHSPLPITKEKKRKSYGYV